MVKTLLIVDDSKMSRMMIKAIVKEYCPDWNIIEAGSGEEALTVVEGKNIDIMTLDLNMPGMDGLTLGIQLQKQYPSAKISLLTANIQDSVRERVDAAGIAFIPKPITEDKIAQFVKE